MSVPGAPQADHHRVLLRSAWSGGETGRKWPGGHEGPASLLPLASLPRARPPPRPPRARVPPRRAITPPPPLDIDVTIGICSEMWDRASKHALCVWARRRLGQRLGRRADSSGHGHEHDAHGHPPQRHPRPWSLVRRATRGPRPSVPAYDQGTPSLDQGTSVAATVMVAVTGTVALTGPPRCTGPPARVPAPCCRMPVERILDRPQVVDTLAGHGDGGGPGLDGGRPRP